MNRATILCCLLALSSYSLSQTIGKSASEFDALATRFPTAFRELDSIQTNGEVVWLGECSSVFGVSENELRFLAEQISVAIVNADLEVRRGHETPKTLGKRIESIVAPILSLYKVDRMSALGQRLVAQAVTDWVRTRVVYNNTLADPQSVRNMRAYCRQPENMLNFSTPFAVCGGYAQLCYEISASLNLEVYQVDGWIPRASLQEYEDQPSHTWNVFTFRNGSAFVSIPSDTSSSAISLQRARELKGRISSAMALPISKYEYLLTFWKLIPKEVMTEKPFNASKAIRVTILSNESIVHWKSQSSARKAVGDIYKVLQKHQSTSRVRLPLPNYRG